MRNVDDNSYGKAFGEATILAHRPQPVTDYHFMHVWDNLKRLAEYEESRHADKNETQFVLFLLLLFESPSCLASPS